MKSSDIISSWKKEEEIWKETEARLLAELKAEREKLSAWSKLALMLKSLGKTGWMDSTDYLCELGEATGGNVIHPTKEECEKAHVCITEPCLGWQCRAERVLVYNADCLEATLKEARGE